MLLTPIPRVHRSRSTGVGSLFATSTYTGNRSTQTITNGINLSANGGMVMTKLRSAPSAGGSANWSIYDSAQGFGTKFLEPNVTAGETTIGSSSSSITPLTTGYSVDTDTAWAHINYELQPYASWTFRKAASFFDIVTWTGNGSNRTISHNLGVVPGMILVKRRDTTSDWQVYHRSLANTEYAVLNTTAAKATGATRWNSTTATSSVFSLGTDASVNASGGTYIAYVFAHDASGVIQCGGFTTDGSGAATVTLGWQPQWILVKDIDNAATQWILMDTARTWGASNDNILFPSSTTAENSGSNAGGPTGTGFTAANFTSSHNHIYMVIRAP